jgi:putative tricarboxylic transport membrane protein
VKIEQVTARKAELAVGLVLVGIAAIVIREAVRLGSGWGPSGPQPGFFPFISAVIMAVGTLIAMVQAVRARQTAVLYDSADQVLEVLKVGGPIVAAVVLLQYVGFYLMTGLYMGLFALWYGRYRWYVALAAAVILPAVIYFAFERGFRISLPKSVLYGDLIPF